MNCLISLNLELSYQLTIQPQFNMTSLAPAKKMPCCCGHSWTCCHPLPFLPARAQSLVQSRWQVWSSPRLSHYYDRRVICCRLRCGQHYRHHRRRNRYHVRRCHNASTSREERLNCCQCAPVQLRNIVYALRVRGDSSRCSRRCIRRRMSWLEYEHSPHCNGRRVTRQVENRGEYPFPLILGFVLLGSHEWYHSYIGIWLCLDERLLKEKDYWLEKWLTI